MRSALAFSHDTTAFPLTGVHTATGCVDCHTSLIFDQAPSACIDCHLEALEDVAEPDHEGLSPSCEQCHATGGWAPAFFDHTQTLFALEGAHRMVDCVACHFDGYLGTPTDCFSCHESDYFAAREPSHEGFSTTCEDCHTVNGWESATSFDHSRTAFPLRGAHRAADCQQCHADGYAGTPTDCFSCHAADYASAVEPDHSTFPTTCDDCHLVTAWEPASFNHSATGFPLRGAHLAVDCLGCHADGYAGTPTDCFSCHAADYDGARDPDHTGFPTTCEDCHSENGWEPTLFDHNQTAFPLDGAHRFVDCQACHAQGFAGTPTDCFSCHADDYFAAEPDHASADFPTTCEDCHNTNDWDDVDWDHDQYFPIFSGSHRNAWNSCQDCHIAGGNPAVFECIFCHEHNANDMNEEHDDVGGYVYESQACLSCHPDGEE